MYNKCINTFEGFQEGIKTRWTTVYSGERYELKETVKKYWEEVQFERENKIIILACKMIVTETFHLYLILIFDINI